MEDGINLELDNQKWTVADVGMHKPERLEILDYLIVCIQIV